MDLLDILFLVADIVLLGVSWTTIHQGGTYFSDACSSRFDCYSTLVDGIPVYGPSWWHMVHGGLYVIRVCAACNCVAFLFDLLHNLA